MSEVQIHLLLNHIPVIGSLFAMAIFAWGYFRKQQEVVHIGLYLFILSAVFAIPVYFSGEGAEEAVEHLSGVSESLIEDHENLAKIAMFIIEALGLASIGALVLSFKQKALPLWYAISLGALSLVNAGVIAQTAHLGGMIRHSEIRQGQSGQAGESKENKEESDEDEKDENKEQQTENSGTSSTEPKAENEGHGVIQTPGATAQTLSLPQDNDDPDHKAVQNGTNTNTTQQVLSLEALMKKAFPNRKVNLIEAKLESESGQMVYELEWLEQGVKQKQYFNAYTGALVQK